MPKKRILVVGGGVTGFTTAWALLDAGSSPTPRTASPLKSLMLSGNSHPLSVESTPT
ncbi:hypothetical protein BDZ89DRAFT_1139793 [Hymenopellis radicata]|nr:hypothetical protein BDZ89DRAFT_1139793 [Hymenopellis radicata]